MFYIPGSSTREEAAGKALVHGFPTVAPWTGPRKADHTSVFGFQSTKSRVAGDPVACAGTPSGIPRSRVLH